MSRIYFWDLHDEYGEFNQWYISEFVEGGIVYSSAGQYMMVHKAYLFKDYVMIRHIYSKIM